MPPSTPASRIGDDDASAPAVSGPACIATRRRRCAPTTNCPSAPMFHTLERKHTARPSAIRISGVALIDSSDSAYALFTGSTKNTCRPRSGSLPSSTNSATPITTVIASASSGEASDISLRRLRAGFKLEHGRPPSRGRAGSSHRPDIHSPIISIVACAVGDAGRHPALRDDDQPVADLEQLVELLADHQQRAAGVAQLRAARRGSAPPRRRRRPRSAARRSAASGRRRSRGRR